MSHWVHIKHSIDQATLHRDRCLEVPFDPTTPDYWGGGWFEYSNKEDAQEALEQSGTTKQFKCPLCKP
ncbi:MAG: hypothetical protein ACE1ZJ_01290 [Nitrospirales bacterium]